MNPPIDFTSNDEGLQWIQSRLAARTSHFRHTRPASLALNALTVTQRRNYKSKPFQHHETRQRD